MPEILETGSDITLVTYGACVHIAKEAVDELTELGIKAELIDVRTLLPFDRYAIIGSSLTSYLLLHIYQTVIEFSRQLILP